MPPSLGVPSAESTDEFEPTDGGCLVTETWIDRRYRCSLPISAFLSAVNASGTSLTEICRLGPITAAIVIGNTGNIDRFATKARFASDTRWLRSTHRRDPKWDTG